MTTPCNRCEQPADLREPHITVVRHVEQQHGDVTEVRESSEIAVFHPACAPTVDDVLEGLIDPSHVRRTA